MEKFAGCFPVFPARDTPDLFCLRFVCFAAFYTLPVIYAPAAQRRYLGHNLFVPAAAAAAA